MKNVAAGLTGPLSSGKVTGMKMRFVSVSVNAINLADRRFCFSHPHEDPTLTRSVAALGIIEPPVLLEKEDLVVVSGWRRISAARQAGMGEIPAVIVAVPEKDAMAAAIEANIGRPLNLVEKSQALERMVRFDFLPGERDRTMEAMGLQAHKKILDLLLSLAAGEEELKNFVVEKNLTLRNLKSLLRFAGEERTSVLQLFETVPTTDSFIREVLDLLALYRLKTGSIDFSIFQGLEDSRSLRRVLRERTHPIQTSLERKWNALRGEIKLPRHMDITVDPFFEKEYIDIHIRVRNQEEAQRAMDTLKSLVEKGDIRRILDLGSG